jgi:sugar phosphate permease
MNIVKPLRREGQESPAGATVLLAAGAGTDNRSLQTSKGGAYAWFVLVLLSVVSFLNYADRTVVTAIMPTLQHTFHLSDLQLGWLNVAFKMLYGVGCITTGYIADRMGRGYTILFGLVFWSICILVSPMQASFMGFLLMRALTGFGEGSYFPSGTALISGIHNDRSRSTALSIHQAATFIGGLVGAVSVAYLAEHYSWHLAFYGYGTFGIVWAVVLYFALRRYMSHGSKPTGKTQIREMDASGKPANTYRIVLGIPSAVLLIVVFFCGNFVADALWTWAPIYFYRQFNTSLTVSAFFGSIQNVSALVAVLVGGVMGDLISRRLPQGRFVMLGASLLIATVFVMGAGLASQVSIAVCCLVGAGFFKGAYDANIYAALHDVIPPSARATATGAMLAVGVVGASVSSITFGALARPFGLGNCFAIFSSLFFVGGLLILLRLRTIRRDIEYVRSLG